MSDELSDEQRANLIHDAECERDEIERLYHLRLCRCALRAGLISLQPVAGNPDKDGEK